MHRMSGLPNHRCAVMCLSVGMLVLDPVSAPRWRLDCSRCSFLIYLPKDLHDARVSKERCEVNEAHARPAGTQHADRLVHSWAQLAMTLQCVVAGASGAASTHDIHLLGHPPV